MLPSLLYSETKPKYQTTADNRDELCADLGLGAVLDAMAAGNAAIREAARNAMFESPAIGCGDILFRQKIASDALNNAAKFQAIYGELSSGLAAYEAARRKSTPGYARVIPVTLRIRTAAEQIDILLTLADKIRDSFGSLAAGVTNSTGLLRYISAFAPFYSKDFIARALREIASVGAISEGSHVRLGAKPGFGMKGTAYKLRAINQPAGITRVFKKKHAVIVLETFSMQVKAIELRDASVSRLLSILNAVAAQTADDLKALHYEWGFYAGCINLHKTAASLGLPICFPLPDAGDSGALSFNNLVDISLALGQNTRPVPNSLDLDGTRLTVVTGANQGGKSTFLRSVGCAQMMAQCGMFVTADAFNFSVRPRVFTHFCKPEDASMDSGKLDEELARLDRIVDRLRPGVLLLMNESFSSTAEREGAAIAREIIGAFYESGVKTVFVTHMYEYARSMESSGYADVRLLRAERLPDGRRTYAIRPGLSLPTSYGMDLFNELFPENN